MAITLTPAPFGSHQWLAGDHLKVTGDVEETLIIPAKRPQDLGDGHSLTESYYIAISDGTLLRATNDPERPDFQTILAGDSRVVVAEKSATIFGTIKWVALASNASGHAISDAVIDAFDAANDQLSLTV